eukprot:SAG22_NODE_21382_length_257_cov_0.981013_1_plen_59_part_01
MERAGLRPQALVHLAPAHTGYSSLPVIEWLARLYGNATAGETCGDGGASEAAAAFKKAA